MSRRTWLAVVLASLLSAVSGALLAQSKVPSIDEPVVLSGPDFGFRVESYERGKPIGTLVVRLNGRWVEPRSVMQTVPLGSR
jgi:hypothetical protein